MEKRVQGILDGFDRAKEACDKLNTTLDDWITDLQNRQRQRKRVKVSEDQGTAVSEEPAATKQRTAVTERATTTGFSDTAVPCVTKEPAVTEQRTAASKEPSVTAAFSFSSVRKKYLRSIEVEL